MGVVWWRVEVGGCGMVEGGDEWVKLGGWRVEGGWRVGGYGMVEGGGWWVGN